MDYHSIALMVIIAVGCLSTFNTLQELKFEAQAEETKVDKYFYIGGWMLWTITKNTVLMIVAVVGVEAFSQIIGN